MKNKLLDTDKDNDDDGHIGNEDNDPGGGEPDRASDCGTRRHRSEAPQCRGGSKGQGRLY